MNDVFCVFLFLCYAGVQTIILASVLHSIFKRLHLNRTFWIKQGKHHETWILFLNILFWGLFHILTTKTNKAVKMNNKKILWILACKIKSVLRQEWVSTSNKLLPWRHIKSNTWARMDIEFLFECLHRSVRCRVEHEKINFISTCNHILLCLSHKHNSPLLTRKVNFISEWR